MKYDKNNVNMFLLKISAVKYQNICKVQKFIGFCMARVNSWHRIALMNFGTTFLCLHAMHFLTIRNFPDKVSTN